MGLCLTFISRHLGKLFNPTIISLFTLKIVANVRVKRLMQ